MKSQSFHLDRDQYHFHHVLILNMRHCRGTYPMAKLILVMIILSISVILIFSRARHEDYWSVLSKTENRPKGFAAKIFTKSAAQIRVSRNTTNKSSQIVWSTQNVALEPMSTESSTGSGDNCESRFADQPKCWETRQLKDHFHYKHTMDLGVPLHEILKENPDVHAGHWAPSECRPVQHVAVVIPYRDRASHLTLLLKNLHAFLKDQQLEYTIIAVEQKENQSFNRGKLMNVGVLEAQKTSICPIDCFVFHDVDTIPQGPGPHYACQEQPKQLSAYQSKWKYKLPYGSYFGGVVSASADQLTQMNGFSNIYWGWGGEDDDAYVRLSKQKWKNLKPTGPVGKYDNIEHKQYDAGKNAPGACRFKLLNKAGNRWKTEGLNSTIYSVLERHDFDLYKWILVDLYQNESEKWINDQKLCK